MTNQQPTITVSNNRRFTTSPTSVLVFVFNQDSELLLLAHPKRHGAWEVVNGGMEAEETVIEATLREASEEIGPDALIRPLGIFHAYTFRYDDYAQFMISICVLAAYEGGPIVPGDDMTGSQHRWWPIADLLQPDVNLIVPDKQPWLLDRAQQSYQLWRDIPADLQPASALDPNNRPKPR